MTAPKLKVVSTTDGIKPRHVHGNQSSTRGSASTYETIGRFALAELDQLLCEFMDRVDDVFFERSDKAGNEQERKRYFDAMREFRNKRDRLQGYFDNQMQRSVAELARHSAYASGHDDDMTRIEIAGTEDKIAIDNLVSRARLQFEDDLGTINKCLRVLLGMSHLGADDNPFDPGTICENFHAASELLKIDIAVKLIFYKIFEKQLMAGLGGFYRELNRQFAEQDVLPGIGTGGTGRQCANSASAAPGSATDGEPVIAALTRLQKKTADIDRSPSSVDPLKFRRSLRQQIDALCRKHRQHLSSRNAKSIEAVGMLFDFFFEDEALPDPIKVLIGRLQVPVLKVAILEADFLTRKQHPARRLLDTISRTSLGWSDNHRDTRLLVGKTREIVDSIITQYAGDAGIFEAARNEFENFVAREAARRDQAGAGLRQQERRIEAARQAVAALIVRLVEGRDLHPEVVKFLRTTWTSVLIKTYLSLGESSNHWRNLKRISTTLVWTLIPRHTEAERDKIIRTIPALLRALSKGMALIKTDMQVQNRVFAVLATQHAKVVKQTSRNIVTRLDDITVWPEDEAEKALAMTGNIDDDESAVTYVDPDRIDSEIDAVMLIDSIGTNEVIKDLNQFTAGVKKGSIRIDEEIVLYGDDDLELDLDEIAMDGHLKLANEMHIGSWVEFIRPDESSQVLRLFWRSAAAGMLVFVNDNGQKVKNMTVNDFAAELRAKRARRFVRY